MALPEERVGDALEQDAPAGAAIYSERPVGAAGVVDGEGREPGDGTESEDGVAEGVHQGRGCMEDRNTSVAKAAQDFRCAGVRVNGDGMPSQARSEAPLTTRPRKISTACSGSSH